MKIFLKKSFFCILFTSVTLLANPAFASPINIGGYDVQKIAAAEAKALVSNGVINGDEAAGFLRGMDTARFGDPLVDGVCIIDFYNGLSSALISRSFVSADDIAALKTAATESGGVKIGGLNPLVLAASHLNLLVQKGAMNVQSAQAILDGAKIKNRGSEVK